MGAGGSVILHYVYITTNLVNGKRYVGSHSTSDLNDGYIGSGRVLWKAVEKYGVQSFEVEILEFFGCREDAYKAERFYIERFGTLSPGGYNLSPTGGTRFKGLHSDVSKEKMRNARLGFALTDSTKEKISKALKGRQKTESTRNKMVKSWKPRILSDEGRINIGIKGSASRVFTEEYRRKISESNKKIKHTEEWNTNVKLGLSRVEPKVCPHCGFECRGGNQTRWHFDKCRAVFKN